ncbi:amidohydrolase [Paenibacillus sp. MY03]|uniref:amidohydrolase family protein n=1 Tax=Paenibacillus sp. MY03 TaxID=302980 RepID=UPI0015C606D1|nr:amidohydrolase family protein [Paenibacillus sp. MY03]
MYLDSHVHFWKLQRGEYSWIAPHNHILFQDRLPSQLEPVLEAQGVGGVILVEAASTVEEIEYMLDLAEQYRWIKGVVGGLDLTQESFEEHYSRFRTKRKFVGIRVNGVKFEQKSEQARRLLLDRLALLQRDQFPIDLLARAHQLPAVLSCLNAVPRLKAVINHLGVPLVKELAMTAWMNDMRSIEALPHTMVKLSGMLTQSGGYRPTMLRPYVQYLARTFRSSRLLFGSDWPVALQGGTYDEAIRLFEALLPAEWDETERQAVRCRNGYRFYGIESEEAAASE